MILWMLFGIDDFCMILWMIIVSLFIGPLIGTLKNRECIGLHCLVLSVPISGPITSAILTFKILQCL